MRSRTSFDGSAIWFTPFEARRCPRRLGESINRRKGCASRCHCAAQWRKETIDQLLHAHAESEAGGEKLTHHLRRFAYGSFPTLARMASIICLSAFIGESVVAQ